MKTNQLGRFSLIVLGFAAALGGCGEDPGVEPSGVTKNDDGTIIPEGKIEVPGPNWVGTKSQYAVVFEERDESDTGAPMDFPRLYVRASDSPHTGSITRLHQSRFIEFEGDYKDGFLEGVAREWDSSGSFIRMVRVKRGIIAEDEIDAKAEDKVASLPVPVAPSSGGFVVPTNPIFVGTNEILSQWTTVIVEDGVNYLLDKRTGEKVTGGLQVHGENGGISYYSEYRDGKLHGRNDNWQDNGVKNIESNYANGVKNGAEIWRDENGTKTWEANYLDGKQHGLQIIWDKGVKTEAHYLDGNKHGLETSWDENGTTISRKSYLNGKLEPPNE